MARSSKTAASKSGGGIKAGGGPQRKRRPPLERKRRPLEGRHPRQRRPAKGRPQGPLRLNPEQVQAEVKRGGGPQRKRPWPLEKKKTASGKIVSKTAATRKRTPARTTPSKSRASAGGGKLRGRTEVNTASRATKTASKRANASRKRSTAKSASNRNGAQRRRRTENANLGAAVTNPVTEAMALGTEVVAGAIQAGGEIAAASADMAMTAARTAAAVTTGVVPEGSQEDESGSKRERGDGRRGS